MTKCKHTNELLKHTQENREKPNSAQKMTWRHSDRPVIEYCAKFAHGSFKFNKSAGEERVIVRAVPY